MLPFRSRRIRELASSGRLGGRAVGESQVSSPGILARPGLPPARNSRPARMVARSTASCAEQDPERYDGGGGSAASATGGSLRAVIPNLGKTR